MVFAAEGYQEELVEVGEHAGTQHQTLHLVAGVADYLSALASGQWVQVSLEEAYLYCVGGGNWLVGTEELFQVLNGEMCVDLFAATNDYGIMKRYNYKHMI